MNMRKWLDDCLDNPRKDPLPILSFPGIQLLDMTVGELVRDGEKQALCMKAIADRYSTLAAVGNMDLSVEAEAFGAETRFDDDEVPNIIGRLVDTAEDAKTLRIPAVGTARTKECIKAIALAKDMIKDRPILAGIIGPFSLAGRLLEMAEIMYKAVDDPDMVHEVLDKVTTFLINYSLALKAAGADGIMMAEPAAGLLSPAWNAEFSVDYVTRIVKAVQDDHFLVVYHNCGNVLPLVDDLIATGASAFHFGNAISMEQVMEKMPADCLVMGNIDPVTRFSRGTPASIAAATADLMNEMKTYKNFVLSSGCDIPPMTPMANIDAFFQAAKGKGKTNTGTF